MILTLIILLPLLLAIWIYFLYGRVRRAAVDSIENLARLLGGCLQCGGTGFHIGGWRLRGMFRGREFEISHRGRRPGALGWGFCAVRLIGPPLQGYENLSLTMESKGIGSLFAAALGQPSVPIANETLNRRLAIRCSDCSFAAALLHFAEYRLMLLRLWTVGRGGGVLRISHSTASYRTNWNRRREFLGEIRCALGLLCDIHDLTRSRDWSKGGSAGQKNC